MVTSLDRPLDYSDRASRLRCNMRRQELLWVFLLVFWPFLSWGFERRSFKQDETIEGGNFSRVSDFEASNISPIDSRSLEDWKLANILLVSDIDGNLHGIERGNGELLWTLPMDEPLVQITSNITDSGEKFNNTSDILWFVEPYEDGTLYYFTPSYGMNKLPTSIRDLVLEAPFSLSGDNKIYTGIRKTSLYSININTGEVVSVFGNSEKCPNPDIYDRSAQLNTHEIIMLGKTTYELRIYSKENNNIMWNVTYSQWGSNNIDNDLKAQNQQSFDNLYFTPFYDKSLLAINKELGTPVWIRKLPLLAANVFDIFNSMSSLNNYVVLPHPWKHLNELQLNNEADSNTNLCFINRTSNGKEWFAMSLSNYATLVKSAPISQFQMSIHQLMQQAAENINIGLVNYLENLPVSQISNRNNEDMVNMISGIHRFNPLSIENHYQPVPLFADIKQRSIKRIEGLKEHKNSYDTPKKVPNIIEGIKLPNSNSRTQPGSTLLLDKSSKDNILLLDSAETARSLIDQGQYLSLTPFVNLNSVWMLRTYDIITLVVLFMLYAKYHRKIISIFKNIVTRSKEDPENHVSDGKAMSESLPSERQKSHLLESAPNPQDISQSNDEFNLVESVPKVPCDELIVTGAINLHSLATLVSNDKEEVEKEVTEEISSKNFSDNLNSTKKKRKRGSRGGKRSSKGKKSVQAETKSDDLNKTIAEENSDVDTDEMSSETQKFGTDRIHQFDNNLIISDKILGYGSHGTVVYQGTFENRPVAVKRMLLDFYDIANHEVSLLQESDDHPNVIRYYCSKLSKTDKFLYIALERCVCTLQDIIEKPLDYPKPFRLTGNNINQTLYQLSSGLHYLHSLKIVHRDIKPQNILVAEIKQGTRKGTANEVRLLISDFGLCKKLEPDQSSFGATAHHDALGTTGWRAPELLLQPDILEISPQTVSSLNGTQTQNNSSTQLSQKRLTKAIDIFSLGCVFFYILSKGSHPFGDRYIREANIIKGEKDLSTLKLHCKFDFSELTDLISSMIDHNPANRPDTSIIMKHPFFWESGKKLQFLLKASDRFEIERRDPPSDILLVLESVGEKVHNGNWHKKFDEVFMSNLGKYRKYHPDKLMDLLRAVRNKYHHFNDMPTSLQQEMSPVPDGFYLYFQEKFPNMLMQVYYIVDKHLKHEHIFNEFF